jgi:acyl-Coa thioesterase superfamily protein/acyl-CoA thioesterase superfamily protein
MTALFEPAGPDRWVPAEATRGPWDPAHQHGGAPGALLAGLIERAEPGAHMRVARVTLEIVRPVPLAELRSEVEVVRPGKRVQLVEARLFAGDELVTRGVALRLRRDEDSRAPAIGDSPAVPAGPQAGRELRLPHVRPGREMFGHDGVDLRYVRGDWGKGDAFVWIALRRPVIGGEEPSPVQRAMAAADFGNGVSAVLDWDAFAFINPDLTVYLERDPIGRWIGLDARTRVASDGTALAESVLFDERGRVGRSLQSLLVQPRTG